MAKGSCHTSLKCWVPKPAAAVCTDLVLDIVRGGPGNDIFVTNNGPIPAQNVVVNVSIASGTLGVQGEFIMNGNVGTWNIGTLNPGQNPGSQFDFTGAFEFTMSVTSDTPICHGPITQTVSWTSST